MRTRRRSPVHPARWQQLCADVLAPCGVAGADRRAAARVPASAADPRSQEPSAPPLPGRRRPGRRASTSPCKWRRVGRCGAGPRPVRGGGASSGRRLDLGAGAERARVAAAGGDAGDAGDDGAAWDEDEDDEEDEEDEDEDADDDAEEEEDSASRRIRRGRGRGHDGEDEDSEEQSTRTTKACC